MSHNESYDLSILLKGNDFNLRLVAKNEPFMTVDEYFFRLSNFIRLAPDVNRALFRFAAREPAIEDYRSLDNMIILLESLGCDRFTTSFHSLLNAYGQEGNWREAAVYAKQKMAEFDDFYSRVAEIQEPQRYDLSHNLENRALSLNEFIKNYDREEANRRPVILAVDDSAAVLHAVQNVLSAEYTVLPLIKPMELTKVLQKTTPDLFLLDYKMPEINGFELVPIIRGFEEHKDTPVVFLTSDGTIDTVTAALGLGACDFVTKPFKPDILLEKIAKHIVKKKPR